MSDWMKDRSTQELIGRYFNELLVWRLLLCGNRGATSVAPRSP